MRKMLDKDQKGFTLIELLVVIAIIGILAAVAIPQFAAYRENAYCSQVESDVSNVMIASEAYYVENDAYPADAAALEAAGLFTATDGVNPPTIDPGPPLSISATSDNCTRGTYTATAGGTSGWAAPAA